jgi:transcriptional regulator with XRE-family HTH domain
MDAADLIRRARTAAGFTLRRLAEQAGTSHATLSAYEAGNVNPSVRTLERIVRAAGFNLEVGLIPLVGGEGFDRGNELVQVLELAARFPANQSRDLKYPRFGSQ